MRAVTPQSAHTVPAPPTAFRKGPDPGSVSSAQPLLRQSAHGHFRTPKGSHPLLPPVGQAFRAINNTLASRQHLYVCLEVPSAASQTWEQGMETEMSLPGLTAPSSSYLQPTWTGHSCVLHLPACPPPAPLSLELWHSLAVLPALLLPPSTGAP